MTRLCHMLIPLMLLAGCGQPSQLDVRDARVQLPAVAANPGAAYFTVAGGPKDDRLVSVTTPIAGRGELHETTNENGMMNMAGMEGGVAVPSGATVEFAPRGKHVMLFDIDPSAKAGNETSLTLTFASGVKLDTKAKIVAAGAGDEHSH